MGDWSIILSILHWPWLPFIVLSLKLEVGTTQQYQGWCVLQAKIYLQCELAFIVLIDSHIKRRTESYLTKLLTPSDPNAVKLFLALMLHTGSNFPMISNVPWLQPLSNLNGKLLFSRLSFDEVFLCCTFFFLLVYSVHALQQCFWSSVVFFCLCFLFFFVLFNFINFYHNFSDGQNLNPEVVPQPNNNACEFYNWCTDTFVLTCNCWLLRLDWFCPTSSIILLWGRARSCIISPDTFALSKAVESLSVSFFKELSFYPPRSDNPSILFWITIKKIDIYGLLKMPWKCFHKLLFLQVFHTEIWAVGSLAVRCWN